MGWHSEGIAASGGLGSCKAHHVGVSPQKDRCRSTCEVEEAEGSSGCTETQAHNFSRRQKTNCSGCTCALGEDTGGEEGGLASLESLLRVCGGLFVF
jgi:hypothetical protein